MKIADLEIGFFGTLCARIDLEKSWASPGVPVLHFEDL